MSEDYVRDHDGGVSMDRIVDPNTFSTLTVFRTRGGYMWREEMDIDIPAHCRKENDHRWYSIREELWQHCLPQKR